MLLPTPSQEADDIIRQTVDPLLDHVDELYHNLIDKQHQQILQHIKITYQTLEGTDLQKYDTKQMINKFISDLLEPLKEKNTTRTG